MKVIDWELSDVGDSLWDVGGLLQAHLLVWLWSMPLESGQDPSQLVAQAAAPIEAQRPAIGHFWQAYASSRGLGPASDSALEKALGLAAARLLQSAFERAVSTGQPDAQSLFLLRAARNMLEHPENTLRHLGLAQEMS